jgi:hypothetical protein
VDVLRWAILPGGSGERRLDDRGQSQSEEYQCASSPIELHCHGYFRLRLLPFALDRKFPAVAIGIVEPEAHVG